jgi:NADH-quinone oxidoreductase subunit G
MTSADAVAAAQPEVVDDGKVGVTIDGRDVRVAKGTLVWDAATAAGVHIPVYCAHPKMDPVAVCRMCLVTVEKMPKLQPACATIVSEGMVVHTQTDQVGKAREGMLEFLLLNHPLDCPVCDRGGECDLQDFAFRYGPQNSRVPITEKVHYDKAVPLSEKIELDNERCILCWRCVRYYDEITGEKEIVLQQRGVDTVVATFDGAPLTSDFQGNLPEVCPVGALTHRQYRFKARPWDLQRAPSICPECSYGCNINVDSREFEVKRFASRDNPLVDDMWLCDRGRYSIARWNVDDRVRRPRLREEGRTAELSHVDAVREAARRLTAVTEKHGGASVGVLASADCTNEEAWLLQRLAREVLGTPHIDHQLGRFEGLSPQEWELGIAELEDCGAVVVLGDAPEREAPVLRLRLYKAERKRGAAIHRVDVGASVDAVRALVDGAAVVGLVADEADRARGLELLGGLRAGGARVRLLTTTRGVNGRGAKDMGLLPNYLPGYEPAGGEGKSGREILEAAAAGQLKALVLLDAQRVIRDAGELGERALARVGLVVAIEWQVGPVADNATVLIPGHTHVEKAGSVTNCEGRVQRIRSALPPATNTPPETRILALLAGDLGATGWPGDVLTAHRALSEDVAAYATAGNGGRALFGAEGLAGGRPATEAASPPSGRGESPK